MTRSFGAESRQTRAPAPGIVALEGGGFIPTLDLGGGGVAVSLGFARAARGRLGS